MITHHYADGVENITLQSGLIRIDYFQFEPAPDAEAPPLHQVNDRLVMTPHAFVQSYQAMTAMMQRMEEEGIISRQSPSQEQIPSHAASTQPPPTQPTSPTSPNFS